MGHYTSFRDKQATPPIRAHARRVYASEAIPANMVSVLKDYSGPNVVNGTLSAPATLRKVVQKAEETKNYSQCSTPIKSDRSK